jgi:hypothetical protein
MPCDTSHHPPWPELLAMAATIVESYDTLVTLRQLFYRLVAAQLLPNTTNAYKSLSKYTAEARRAGTFPALMDRGRTIHRYHTFTNPTEARRWLQSIYRRDRTEGQIVSVYLGVENQDLPPEVRSALASVKVVIKNVAAGDGHVDFVHEIKAWDKPRALEMLAKHFKLLTDQVEVDVTDPETLAARAAAGRLRAAARNRKA